MIDNSFSQKHLVTFFHHIAPLRMRGTPFARQSLNGPWVRPSGGGLGMNWRTTALFAALGAWVWLWWCSPLAFEIRFRHRIHPGMTLAEAEAVLGKGEFRKR